MVEPGYHVAPSPPGAMSEAAPPLADGRYRLISVLGEGGMAKVYRGFDSRLQVQRAIKILSPELAKRRSLRVRFEGCFLADFCDVVCLF